MTAPEAPVPTAGDPGDWSSRGHIHSLVLMAVTVGGLYLCYRMALPFLPALAWALALALLLVPVQRWLEPRVRSPGTAAGILVLLAGVVVLLPAMLVADRLVDEVARGGAAIGAMLGTLPDLDVIIDYGLSDLVMFGIVASVRKSLRRVTP